MYFMLETLGAIRTGDMFDIVVDYPDSAPAVADMAECLRLTSLHNMFTQRFKQSLQQRLLHAGAATADIIHTYVSTIRALKEIDPSGELVGGWRAGAIHGGAVGANMSVPSSLIMCTGQWTDGHIRKTCYLLVG